MLKNLKLSTKLWSFTMLLLLATLIVAGSSIIFIKSILDSSSNYSAAAEHDMFLVRKEIDHLKWIGKVQELFAMNLETLEVELDHTKCGLGKFLNGKEAEVLSQSDAKLGSLINDLRVPHKHLHESGSLIKSKWRHRHEGLIDTLKDRLDDHRKWASKVAEMSITRNPNIIVQMDHTLCGFGKLLASEEYARYSKALPAFKEAMETAREPHRGLHESAKEIKSLIQSGEFEKASEIYGTVTLKRLEEIQHQFKKAIDAELSIIEAQAEARQIFENKTIPVLKETQTRMNNLSDHLASVQNSAKESMVSTGARSQWSAGTITVIASIIGGILSFLLIRSITKTFKRIIAGLDAGADQVAAASGQVSSSSQQLAEGASEQAASIEETSSSLEEMSAMTKQNAQHADQADLLMKDANKTVVEASEFMNGLTVSMKEISKASEETSKIIKTIDEISFQTNLLALNAAVEAARAGEAGAGFAVVADEVRSLAMRAAEAAKNTADLIQGTKEKVEAGSALANRTNEAFSKVAESAIKVGDLVGEISAASADQASGIDQVNKAVAEMDKVVQANSGNAEENASASEEMNAQAEQMKVYVAQLVAMVEGNSNNSRNQSLRQTTDSHLGLPQKGIELLTIKRAAQKENKPYPHQVIPFDEGDFKDF